MKSPENIEKLIRNAEIRSNPDVNRAVLEDLVKQFVVTEQEQKASVASPDIRRILMKNPIIKIAAAAVIIIAIVFGLFGLTNTGSTSGVIWAEVAEKIEASNGYTFRTRQVQTVNGLSPREMNSTTHYSPAYGLKVDSCPGEENQTTTYINFADKTRIMLIHRNRKYTQDSLPEDIIPQDQGQFSPKDIVAKFLTGEYKELGQQTIDGILAEGIEIDNPPGGQGNFSPDRCTGQLWVSVETGYPVKLEMDVVANDGNVRIEMTVDQFEWNVELNPSVFEVDIPSDFTLIEMP